MNRFDIVSRLKNTEEMKSKRNVFKCFFSRAIVMEISIIDMTVQLIYMTNSSELSVLLIEIWRSKKSTVDCIRPQVSMTFTQFTFLRERSFKFSDFTI